MKVVDTTSTVWVTAFQDSAEKILGCSAQDLGRLREEDESRLSDVMKGACFKPYDMTFRTKMETYLVSVHIE